MNKKHFPESELIINADGSCFHLHLKPTRLFLWAILHV